jgi:hypothetical protein
MHAAAIARDDGAVLIVGPSGMGKSTLSTLLCERGWRFMGDDIAPVRMSSDDVLPFPVAPYRRIGIGRKLPPLELGTLKKELVVLSPDAIQTESVSIKAIVFPAYRGRSRPKLTRLPLGTAAFELLRSYANFIDHGASAVARASALAVSVPAFQLVYTDGRAAAEVLDAVL